MASRKSKAYYDKELLRPGEPGRGGRGGRGRGRGGRGGRGGGRQSREEGGGGRGGSSSYSQESSQPIVQMPPPKPIFDFDPRQFPTFEGKTPKRGPVVTPPTTSYLSKAGTALELPSVEEEEEEKKKPKASSSEERKLPKVSSQAEEIPPLLRSTSQSERDYEAWFSMNEGQLESLYEQFAPDKERVSFEDFAEFLYNSSQ